MKKYKVGTRLKCLQENAPYFKKGEVYIVSSSLDTNYPDTYTFNQIKNLPYGWSIVYIENPEQFKLAKITNWKDIINYKV